MDVVTGGRDCPTNSNKHTLQLFREQAGYIPKLYSIFLLAPYKVRILNVHRKVNVLAVRPYLIILTS